MWKNYGKTFIEYIFLDFFRKNKIKSKYMERNFGRKET